MSVQHQLRELVDAIVTSDDPTLLQRACFALDVILSADPERD